MATLPTGMTRAEVAAHLRTMADGVESGDTTEGNIEFLLPTDEQDEADFPGAELLVRGGYRINNLMGQGGFRMLSTMSTE